MTDQHRFDRLSCLDPRGPRTPALDGLAAQGVLFQNAYTPCPVCAPARAALKSGMFPPGCGVVGNWVPFKRDVPLLTQRLHERGYQNALVGKLHLMPHLGRYGFDWRASHDAPYSTYAHDHAFSDYIHWLRDRWQGDGDPVNLFDTDEEAFRSEDWYRFIMGSSFRTEEEHETAWINGQVERFLDERDRDKPFFLFASYFGPHQPFDPPEPWRSLYHPDEIELSPQFEADMREYPVFAATCGPRAALFRRLFDRAAYQRMLAAYYGQVSMIDYYTGRLFARLQRDGLWDNTVVIFVSDHGDHNSAYGLFFKGQMYDTCAKVPLIVRAPGGLASARRGQIVNALDLYGTILDYAGDAAWQQPGIEARTLLPLLGAQPGPWRNETHSIIGENPQRNTTMLRRDGLKLIRLARGPVDALYELYDLAAEPLETHDVYADPAYRAAGAALRADLDAWWRDQAAKYPAKVVSYVRGDA